MDVFAMELKLYDTLTRDKRVFTPIDAARVRMYVCGPTVYDFAHIGNARPVIVFDVLFRLLRHLYGEKHVTYVRNITDVDDKINARAAERGIPIRELTDETYKNFKTDVAALGCLEPTVEPRATEHIEEMKVLIERLVKSGHAYVAEGNVLFNVPSMPDYGKLSNRPLDEMIAGARVEVAPYKKDPQDFILWKPSKPGEPGWASPAGIKTPGRPGWHIECSAMSWKHLGETFDIHGGGIDLVFPHHENEIAQSRCAFHTGVMANYWMHNGFLQVEGEKMSKSLGNFLTIRDQLDHWGGSVLRLNMLKTHYRQPIDWTEAGLKETGRELSRWIDLIQSSPGNDVDSEGAVADALSDDLNTPGAITQLRNLYKSKNVSALRSGMIFLGLSSDPNSIQGRKHKRLYAETGHYSIGGQSVQLKIARVDGTVEIDAESRANIEKLIDARNVARKAKDFKETDRIRDELAKMGIVLKDSKDGTTWEFAR
jgi:cysteinyl-tRNA synthetase